MIKLINKANEQIQKVIDYLELNKEIFGYMNLKLHDVSYYIYDKMEEDFPLLDKKDNFYFNWFCEDNYNFMKENLKEDHNIDFDDFYNQLGRTSSFYLHDGNMIDYDINNGVNVSNTIENILYNNYMGSYTVDFLENGFIDNDYTEAIEDDLNYIINDLYKDFTNEIDDIKIIYDYIKDFKDNQVDNFKYFLEFYQEQEEEELQAEKEEKEKSRAIVNGIINKYSISHDDVTLLKNHI